MSVSAADVSAKTASELVLAQMRRDHAARVLLNGGHLAAARHWAKTFRDEQNRIDVLRLPARSASGEGRAAGNGGGGIQGEPPPSGGRP